MGCTIVFVILLVIGMGILCFLTGDMAAFIALSATLVVGLGLAGILYHIYKSKQRRMEKYNPLSPTLRWMNAAGSILIAASQHGFLSSDLAQVGFSFSHCLWNFNNILSS